MRLFFKTKKAATVIWGDNTFQLILWLLIFILLVAGIYFALKFLGVV